MSDWSGEGRGGEACMAHVPHTPHSAPLRNGVKGRRGSEP